MRATMASNSPIQSSDAPESPVKRLYRWVLSWADSPLALWALALLAAAEASFFPIPPDVLLLAMCLGSPKDGFKFAAFCAIGSVLGGLLGYLLGAFAWQGLSGYFFSWIPGFTPAAFEGVQALYQEWGIWIVFTAGFSPIPYKLFTVASGVMGMELVPFLLASLVSRSLRFFLVAGLIYRFGEQVRAIIERYFNLLALLFTVLLVGGVLLVKVILV